MDLLVDNTQGGWPRDADERRSGSERNRDNRWELELPADVDSVRVGRRFAAGALAEWSIRESVAADAIVIVSELLTNAVLHGAPPIALRLELTEGTLSIEVDDGDRTMPKPRRPEPNDPGGRGLLIVAALSRRWASCERRDGKTVWSSLAL